MNLAYFDCFSGISGDMVLGALVDAGVDLRELELELRKLNLEGWEISAEKVQRKAIRATKVNVETKESHHHRHLSPILKMIDQAALAPRAADRARKIFQRLGEAEAKVHNISIEKVHFHEVGAVDSIIDIVGSAIGFELLGIDGFACSIMDVGSGRVQTEHGLLPVPAPATAELLRDAPTFSSGIEKELVTPTGAAIATTLSTQYAQMPAMKLRAVGYGAGSADLPQQPNVLRLMIGEMIGEIAGESADHGAAHWDAPIAVIEANLDDMSPQIYGYFAEQALAAGALDIFSTAVQMKKNRPGQLVTVLCEPSNLKPLIDLIFRETTTIGIRTHEVRRQTLARESVPVDTPLGTIRMKLSRLNGTVLNAAPEYEDCRRIATEQGLPLKEVLATANFHFQKRGKAAK
ncbi:MAG TPA: nickel pincer cofactor biosynthesis protein LarC [Candidatus Acidoferrales bacterium]|nr:nickel pincer cofactor biosynthesis protein LarC [Candidatus Acidoferrales bacterium]